MNTLDTLRKIFDEVFEHDAERAEIKEDSSLVEDLGINSIGMLYMAMAIEENFGVKFDNGDFEKLRTVADVVRLLESKK